MKKNNQLLLIILGIFAFQGVASAFKFTAEPAYPNKINGTYFTFELKPGDSNKETLKIKNTDNKSNTYQIDAVDSTVTTDGKTGFTVAKQKQKEFGNWVSISEKEITLEPNQEKLIEFIVNPPADVALGDYTGAITVTTDGGVKENVDNQKVNIGISQRFAVKSFLKLTDTPQVIEKAPPVNIKTNWAQYYFLASAGIFVIVLGVFLIKSSRKSSKT